VLDLEQRRIARISDSFVKTRYFPLMCHRAQCHIGAEAKDGSMAIIALDGRTGRITAAVRMPGFFFGEVKPTHIAAGALWLHDRDEARLNALHFAVLDTTTLHPLRHHGPDVVDVRDQVDRWLNLRDVGVGAVSPNTNAQNKP
jgi:hypothetical protein